MQCGSNSESGINSNIFIYNADDIPSAFSEILGAFCVSCYFFVLEMLPAVTLKRYAPIGNREIDGESAYLVFKDIFNTKINKHLFRHRFNICSVSILALNRYVFSFISVLHTKDCRTAIGAKVPATILGEFRSNRFAFTAVFTDKGYSLLDACILKAFAGAKFGLVFFCVFHREFFTAILATQQCVRSGISTAFNGAIVVPVGLTSPYGEVVTALRTSFCYAILPAFVRAISTTISGANDIGLLAPFASRLSKYCLSVFDTFISSHRCNYIKNSEQTQYWVIAESAAGG